MPTVSSYNPFLQAGPPCILLVSITDISLSIPYLSNCRNYILYTLKEVTSEGSTDKRLEDTRKTSLIYRMDRQSVINIRYI